MFALKLLDMWEAFQFEKSQTSELLLSHRHTIVPNLQHRISAASAELEGLIQKALSGPFMDPLQDQRNTEQQLLTMELQYQNTATNLQELHQAYVTITGTEGPCILKCYPVIITQLKYGLGCKIFYL